MNKAAIFARLSKVKIRELAEAYLEQVRLRLAAEITSKVERQRQKTEINAKAWEDMWQTFEPAVKRLEKEQKKQANNEEQPALTGIPDNVDALLDPDYSETDPGKWIRDSLLWTAAEISRVVQTSPEGTTLNFNRAKTPPPHAFAVTCMGAFALKPTTALITKVLPFATKSHETTEIPPENESFLHELEP